MALSGLFGKKQQPAASADWIGVASRLSATLWHLMQTNPKILASPLARIVLRDDWSVAVAADKRDPDKLLGPRDIALVFLQEDESSLMRWVGELKADSSPAFQQLATEEYAKQIARALMAKVKV